MIFPLKNKQRSSVKRRSDTSVIREERAILIEWIHFFVGLSASSVRTRKRVACERIRHKIKGLSKNSIVYDRRNEVWCGTASESIITSFERAMSHFKKKEACFSSGP